MSFKVNVDIVIALSALKISSFRKQGLLRFRVALFQTHKLHTSATTLQKQPAYEDLPCNPYNIYKKKRQAEQIKQSNHFQPQPIIAVRGNSQHLHESIDTVNNFTNTPLNSFIDYDQDCYYSRICESRFQSQRHKIEQSCFFRTYIDVQKIDSIEFKLKVELLFAPEGQKDFIEAGAYEAIIHKIHGISTFLPILFDQFGGFAINGTYQSTIMEYRFEGSDQPGTFNNFTQYIAAATQGLRNQQLMRFYDYYRKSLQCELFSIQERHSDLLRILNIPHNYGFIKIAPNNNLHCMIEDLDHKSGLMRQRNGQLLNWQQAKQRIVDELNRDFLGLKAIIYQKWNEYILFLGDYMKPVTEHFKSIYDANVKERLKNYIFSHRVEYHFDWTFSRYEDSGKILLKQVAMDNHKLKEHELWTDAFPIESKNFFEAEGKNIKIFQEVYSVTNLKKTLIHRLPTAHSTRQSSYDAHSFSSNMTVHEQPRKHFQIHNHSFPVKPPQIYSMKTHLPNQFHQRQFHQKHISQKIRERDLGEQLRMGLHELKPQKMHSSHIGEHIIVFVHGYQASRQDFILFKSCLQIKYKCRVFISSSNEGRTEETIENLGKRLAVELNNFFKNIEFGPNTRLSFVGHSMGGIIIRSALSYIKNIDPYLYTYMSFSSPHLGYLYEPSALVQAGLWLLNTWQKSESLDEICMREMQDPRKSFLYRLSESNSLNGFKNLVFLSSSQDEYVPYESARIEKNNLLLNQLGDSLNATIIKEMVDNILGQVRCSQISRMNVVFNIEDNNFDSIIGRTAHVKYLSDQKFIKLFCSIFDKYLE